MAFGLPPSRLPFAAALRSYFRSGWAFLIPYLAAYLLYWWLHWPVNPPSADHPSPASGLQLPCLLHVYWALHAINVVLAVVALVAWLRCRRREFACEQAPTETPAAHGSSVPLPLALFPAPGSESSQDHAESTEKRRLPNGDEGVAAPGPPSALRFKPKALSPALLAVAPWLLLALLFWIPGVYLEWPADPWEHFRRINEWSSLQTIVDHYYWTKVSYFLAFSLLGTLVPAANEIFWLGFFYTGACLLLCWQYYRLARAVGLGERTSMIFVLLQALLFGNNIFGFYRYYGMSSTVFSQLGAIALIRVGLEAARGERRLETGDGNLEPASGLSSLSGTTSLLPPVSCLLRAAIPALALLPLIAFNHIQGIGIASLGLAAVIIWRLVEWRRSMIWWLAAAAIALSVAAVLWWPRNPTVDRDYVPQGWFTAWYGFNLFSPSSPALDRTMAILGIFGVVNLLAAGVLLLRHNRVVGWLTVTPIVALSLPIFVIPFANAVAQHGPAEILTFHRLLLAIPAGLALIALGDRWWKGAGSLLRQSSGAQSTGQGMAMMEASASLAEFLPKETRGTERDGSGIGAGAKGAPLPSVLSERGTWTLSALRLRPKARGPALAALCPAAFFLLPLTLAALLVVPIGKPFYNRFWQSMMVPPGDLTMQSIVSAAEPVAGWLRGVRPSKLVATPAVAAVFSSISPRRFSFDERLIGRPVAGALDNAVALVRSNRLMPALQPPTLTHDPLAADPSAWKTVAGAPPEFVSRITDCRLGSTALRNPPGRSSEVFTSELIPIDPAENYRVEWSAIQRLETRATAYFAVAWFDASGRLLVAAEPAPGGAGGPAGWSNGTYSYFRTAGPEIPASWTTYRVSIGPDGEAAIPSPARFVRVGALLNHNVTPGAVIELTNIRLWRRSATELIADGVFPGDEKDLVVAPSAQTLWSPASQAAQSSHHWPAQQVAADLGGGPELSAAAHAADERPADPGAVIFVPGEKPPASVPDR